MENKIYTIYIIENIITDKKYVGFTSGTIKNRLKNHIQSAYKNKTNQLLHKSIKKYGKQNFKIYEIYQSKDKKHCLSEMEEYFIRLYNTHYIDGTGYNMTYGGDGTNGYMWSHAQREAKSQSQIGEKNHMYKKVPWNKGIQMWPDGRQPLTEESMEKLKSTLKEYYKNNDTANKGKKAITDGKINRYIFENEELPDGFRYGFTKINQYNKGKKAITDGNANIYITDNEELPDGFWYGFTKVKK